MLLEEKARIEEELDRREGRNLVPKNGFVIYPSCGLQMLVPLLLSTSVLSGNIE